MQRSRFIRGAASMAALMVTLPLAGCGGGADDPGLPGPSPAPAPGPDPVVQTFAYVANYSSGDVSVFRVEDSGVLNPVGTPAPSEFGAASVVIHPSGRFAYVLYEEGQTHISTYSIDPVTGELTFRANVEFADEPVDMRIHPGGAFAYVLVPGAESVVICTVDAGSGALSAPAPFPFGSLPRGMDMDAAGKTLYVTTDTVVSAYTILDSGGLNLHSSAATEAEGWTVAVDLLGRALYVAAGHNIATHAIDPLSGQLGEADLVAAPGAGPVALDPSGRFLVASTGTFGVSLSVYAINADTGRLTSGDSFLVDGAPQAIAFSKSGRMLYMTNGESVHPYSVDEQDGVLEAKPSLAAGDEPSGITIVDIAH